MLSDCVPELVRAPAGDYFTGCTIPSSAAAATPPPTAAAAAPGPFSYFEHLPYGGLLGPFPTQGEKILRFLAPALPYIFEASL